VLPLNGSLWVPVPGRPSIRNEIQISCCGVGLGLGVGVGVGLAVGDGVGVAVGRGVGLGVGVGAAGIIVTDDRLGVETL